MLRGVIPCRLSQQPPLPVSLKPPYFAANSMHVTIIIATRNRCVALRDTLRALSRVRVPEGLSTEVLVVDNGSVDDTRECIKSAKFSQGSLRYLLEPRRGKSNALNTAVAAARGEVCAFLDDDVRPDAYWLEHITAPILESRNDALSGVVRIAPHLLRTWMNPTHLAWLASTHDVDPSQPQSAVGANMAVARRVFDRVPWFDPELGPGRLGLWEDTLFSSQLLRAGYRLGFAGNAIVEHYFDRSRLSREAFLSHAKNQGRSHAYVAWHWNHIPRPTAPLYALNYRFRLAAKRLVRRAECDRSEGIAPWEMNLTCGIAFADQLRVERRRPRAYAQFGALRVR